MEIPENDMKRDIDAEVERACKVVVDDFAKYRRNFAEVGCTEALYHDTPAFNVDVLLRMAELFKAKGYFARWNYNQMRTRYGMTIAKYASNNDI